MTETTVRGMKGMKSVMDLPVMQVRLLAHSRTFPERPSPSIVARVFSRR